MSQSSPTLALPFLQPSQAQKHVTHNEALKILDAATQLSVLAADLTDPPTAPAHGDCYIPAPAATGDWASHAGEIAIYVGAGWQFFEARQGWRADVIPTGQTLRFDGSTWAPVVPDLQNLPELGVNTTADTTNRLAVASDATLLTHDGDGHQLKVNKAGAADTASLLFQTGFSGRAEMGTTGSDDFAIKVSADGNSFHTAAEVNKNDGTMAVQGLASLKANHAALNSLLFTPGGDGTISAYRINATSTAPARSAAISGLAGDVITLTTSVALQLFETIMDGVSYIRIWNISKATPESAWVKAAPTTTQLQVTDAAHISGWSAGDTLQAGDPTGHGFGGNTLVLDISPMLTNLFGQPFRQSGILCKSVIMGGSSGDKLALTPSGQNGSFVTSAIQDASSGTTIIPATEPSPVSNSNLLGIRETISTTATVRLVSIMGVFA